jgi:signal transduction histidine kinase
VTSSTGWLARVVQVALDPSAPPRLDTVVGVIGEATGASSAVLWEEARDETGSIVPSVLAQWHDGLLLPPAPRAADPITRAVLASRQPAADTSVAAVPVDYLDGSAGVLTLVGSHPLTSTAFDTAADLVTVLPQLCDTLRDRQTLALANACAGILREAETESATEPLPPGRLGKHLRRVCETVGDSLNCRDVSIYLQQPGESDRYFPLVATSSPAAVVPEGVERSDGLTGWSIAHATPGVARLPVVGAAGPSLADDRTLMVAPLVSGERVWGAISCSGACGPPFHFTQADVSLLMPVAAQIAQYWSSWLHRRTISAEIESWRQMAAAITDLNRLLAQELKQTSPHDDRVCHAALGVVQDVVPDCAGASVYRTRKHGNAAARLDMACSVGLGPDSRDRAEPSSFVRSVHLARRQESTVSPVEGLEGLDPAMHWHSATPIRVGDKVFGVLDAYGPSTELPANAAQVCEIIGDQLGLYLHLRQTLHHLNDTRQRLETTNRSQAEALEDLEHQLVSPLITATSRTDVLLGGRTDSRTAAQIRAVRGLCRKASRVAMSAGVFAALSRGTAPAPKAEPHGCDDILRLLIAAADDAQELSNPRRKIRFDVDRESVRTLGRRLVSVDRSFMEQCVGNVLDNAAKYSYEGTRVDIRGETVDGTFTIGVTSTGLSVDPDDVQHCVHRNWRGELARTSTGEGSGLGLWIVDHLMRSMRGSVQVVPDNDVTTVRLTVPVVEQAWQRRS